MSDILIPFPYSEGKFRALLEANLIWPTLPFNQGCTNFLCNPLKVARTFNNQLWIGNVHHYDIQTNLFSVAYPDNDEEELNLHELYESLVWFPGYPSTTNKHTELRADGGSFPLYLINPYDNNDHFEFHRKLSMNSELAELIVKRIVDPADGIEWSRGFAASARDYVILRMNEYKATHSNREPPVRRILKILGEENPYFNLKRIPETSGQPFIELRRGQGGHTESDDLVLVSARPGSINDGLGHTGGPFKYQKPFSLLVLDPRRGGRMHERNILIDHIRKVWFDPYHIDDEKDATCGLGSPVSFCEAGISHFGVPVAIKRKPDPAIIDITDM